MDCLVGQKKQNKPYWIRINKMNVQTPVGDVWKIRMSTLTFPKDPAKQEQWMRLMKVDFGLEARAGSVVWRAGGTGGASEIRRTTLTVLHDG